MGLTLDVKGKSQEEVGSQLIVKVVENLYVAEKEVNEFLGGLVGLSAKDFENLSIAESFKYIEEFKSLDGVKDFLKLAARSMK